MRGNVFGAPRQPARHARSTPARSACRAGSTPRSARTSPPRCVLVVVDVVRARGARQGDRGRVRRRATRSSVADFMVVSVVGGAPLVARRARRSPSASRRQCAQRDWDLDNVAAPIVTAAGDIVTLPSLFLATYLARHPLRHAGGRDRSARSPCVVAVVAALRTRPADAAPHRASSRLPVLVVAGIGRRARRPDDREAHRVVPRVPGAARARARRSSRTRARSAASSRPGVSTQAAPRHPRADGPVAAGGPSTTSLLVLFYAVPVFVLLGVSADIAASVCRLRPARAC